MDESEDRWYEWLSLPFAALVFVGAIAVIAFVAAMKMPRTAYRLVRRKMHNRVRVRSVLGAVRTRLLLREFILLLIVAAMIILWGFDHRKLVKERDQSDRSVMAFKDELNHLEQLAEGLQKQVSSQGGDRLAMLTEDELFRMRFDAHRHNRHKLRQTENPAAETDVGAAAADENDTF